jgi:hypothetical protein
MSAADSGKSALLGQVASVQRRLSQSHRACKVWRCAPDPNPRRGARHYQFRELVRSVLYDKIRRVRHWSGAFSPDCGGTRWRGVTHEPAGSGRKRSRNHSASTQMTTPNIAGCTGALQCLPRVEYLEPVFSPRALAEEPPPTPAGHSPAHHRQVALAES